MQSTRILTGTCLCITIVGCLALCEQMCEPLVSGIFQDWYGLTLGGEMVQVIQLIATIVIGGIAALIAWRQWKTAQDKVKLDLFDRRFAVFMDVRRVVSEAVSLGKISDVTLPREIVARGRFLFGPEINKQLGEFHKLCTSIEIGEKAAHDEIYPWFNQFIESLEPYMHMGGLKS